MVRFARLLRLRQLLRFVRFRALRFTRLPRLPRFRPVAFKFGTEKIWTNILSSTILYSVT